MVWVGFTADKGMQGSLKVTYSERYRLGHADVGWVLLWKCEQGIHLGLDMLMGIFVIVFI